ncbi:hypothetical protein MUCCIDRAFT_158561 [Mucor lusitanicus CBS 277.49]|uniref:Helicase ATP-binding domain-containing protein n=1 Tax=Mucor lusitanicus CBS 277.49 TaxID=747725 RepID=A0A168PWP0_MUCCL|nr:hypothetical protein MUCCIDRAFT_158561 [Mucor lusitanicus CBS 277.49]
MKDMAFKWIQPYIATVEESNVHIGSAPVSFQLLHKLRVFLGILSANFSCAEQAIAVNAILDGKNDIAVVMPTSAGKTICYLLSCAIEAKTGQRLMTVVILPLISLMNDFSRRCQEANLTCTYWRDEQNTDSAADILILYIEQCLDIKVMAFLDENYRRKQTRRFVVDEVHLVHAWSNFRSCFRSLPALRRFHKVPFVLLTATLPTHLEFLLAQQFGNFQCIRSASCNRPSLKYVVHIVKDIEAAVVHLPR